VFYFRVGHDMQWPFCCQAVSTNWNEEKPLFILLRWIIILLWHLSVIKTSLFKFNTSQPSHFQHCTPA